MDYGTGWLPSLPDPRDLQYKEKLLSFSNMEEILGATSLPPKVDLRPICPQYVYDQRSINSCVGQSIAFLLSFLFKNQRGTDIVFSPMYIYWHARYIAELHTLDKGAYLRDGMKAINRWGACPMSVWEHDEKNLYTQPKPEAYESAYQTTSRITYSHINTMQEIKISLSRNCPVVFGFAVPEGFNRGTWPADKVLTVPPPHVKVVGGHAAVIIGYDDDKSAFLIRNSWGASWGDNGHFWLSYQFFELNLASDFWIAGINPST